jgi:hypothetical protein
MENYQKLEKIGEGKKCFVYRPLSEVSCSSDLALVF